MNKFTTLILSLWLLAGASSAQVNVSKAPEDPNRPDTVKKWAISGVNSLLLNQSSFSNWASGGINSVAGTLLLDYNFNYTKERWNWDNHVLVGYGFSKQKDVGLRKTDDRYLLYSNLGYKLKGYWYASFFASLQSQFANGFEYNSDGTETLISGPFAPAYVGFGPGITYKKSDNWKINISPLASRITLVNDDYLSSIGAFGVDPGKKSRYEFGFNLNAYRKDEIMKNINLEHILMLYSNYLDNPQNVDINYTLNLFMKVNSYISANFGIQLIYDDDTTFPYTNNAGETAYRPQLQFKEIFGAGFTYKFGGAK
ncbi:DUF3078 domain-containing protein [Solitalea canadensis]|uniref:DUF3078 domain-containing protein n=1 Tax=Solitalea canadensis (strain ATCC 29591 / DSM 3403 / JCM 21819 / LMG 8368 / NBRC 15130 / NCIMB 12057 / USAM 9D) TaxID=929556 RepID=H8KWR8_SOLCM|nr:DUF3078 domain-containing protein [Solitalea canadensis]AFD08247.1 Protein of unknown function (DUF3078) [Solitalea canadensis DSM 3403]